MLQKVIEALEAECEKNKNDQMYEDIAKKIIAECEAKSQTLGKMEKALDAGKNIRGAIDKMKGIAKGRAVNGCAYIPPEEGFEIIYKYFGIDPDAGGDSGIVSLEALL